MVYYSYGAPPTATGTGNVCTARVTDVAGQRTAAATAAADSCVNTPAVRARARGELVLTLQILTTRYDY